MTCELCGNDMAADDAFLLSPYGSREGEWFVVCARPECEDSNPGYWVPAIEMSNSARRQRWRSHLRFKTWFESDAFDSALHRLDSGTALKHAVC